MYVYGSLDPVGTMIYHRPTLGASVSWRRQERDEEAWATPQEQEEAEEEAENEPDEEASTK